MKYLSARSFLLLLCLSLTLALAPKPALAFDYPDTPAPEAPAPVGATMGPGGAVQFGWYWPKLSALNEELRVMGLPSMGGSFCVGGTVRYSIDTHWQVGYTGGGWGLSSSGIVEGQVKEVNLGFSFHNLGVFYKFYPDPQWTVILSASPGYYLVRYEKRVTGGTYHYGDGQTPTGEPTSISVLTGSCWGGEVMGGVCYAINPIISLAAEVSYLKAYISSLNQAGRTMADAPTIDLGGWLFRLGLQLNL